MSTSSITTQLWSQIAEWKMRPCIIEFRSAFTMIAGPCIISEASETTLRFCLTTHGSAGCELVIPLQSPPLSVTVNSFAQASESTFQAAIGELTEELGQPFPIDVVEQVADIRLACGATLLIGPLRQEVDPDALISAPQLMH